MDERGRAYRLRVAAKSTLEKPLVIDADGLYHLKGKKNTGNGIKKKIGEEYRSSRESVGRRKNF